MTHPENGKPLWDESRVEFLLEEFFRREMPAPLREASPSRPQYGQGAAISRAANSRANSKTGGAMVGVTLLLLLMFVLVVWNPVPRNPGSNSKRPSSEASNAQNNGREDVSSDGLWNNQGDGPIELRPRVHSVGTADDPDPMPGKSPFPELDVEVYPLDGESPMNRDESRQPDSPRTPMPEEHRPLPENQPEAGDPDEARLEPFLPELEAVFPVFEQD